MSRAQSDIQSVTARCIQCNEFLFYDGKKNVFSPYLQHECGGNVDAMVGTVKVAGRHPFFSEKTFYTELGSTPYFYAYKNRNGEYFVYHDEKLKKI